MRPKRLELSGFTAFREPTQVDFHGVDLFALTGPTGSGKSSIIDAIVFALYGSVPRYGDRRTVEPVISLGKVESRVRFDFTVGDEQYSAVRVVRRHKRGASTKEARLERGGEVVAGTADEVTVEVEKLLGLSYDHFVKSVVLPQGKFAAFLHDKPTDRQKLLRELLDLGIYEQIRERARDRRVGAQQRVEILEGQINDLAYATEEVEALAVKKVETLRALLATVEAAEQEIQRLDADAATWSAKAEAARVAVEQLESVVLPDGLDELTGRSEHIEKEHTAALQERTAAEAARHEAEQTLAALPNLTEIDALIRAHRDVAGAEKALEEIRRRKVEAESDLAKATGNLAAAETDLEDARSALDGLRTTHAAHEIANGLRPGDECPVCGTTVTTLPEREAPAGLDAAVTHFEQAERSHRNVLAAHAQAKAHLQELTDGETEALQALDRARAFIDGKPDVEAVERQRRTVVAAEETLRQVRAREDAARKVIDDIERRRRELVTDLKEAWRRFDRTRDRIAALGPPEPTREDLRADWAHLIAWAGDEAGTRAQKAKEAAGEAVKARETLDERRRTLVGTMEAAGVTVDDRPVRDVCVDALAKARGELEKIQADRKKAGALREKVDEQRAAAAVAAELEKHLRSNRFEAWLLEEALAALTIGANRLLSELSSGTYSIEAEGREFVVVDHRNADERRPVKTLSGGETFLVSLALALSLSEQIAGMSTTGNVRLESIFLDEGFGTLDDETLDVVASVIHELGATGRTVGLVSHVRDLAEQVPVRYVVTKDATTARVEKIES